MPAPTLGLMDVDLREIIFTWEEEETGIQYNFAVDRIIHEAQRSMDVILTNVAIDPVYAEQLLVMRDLEAHRLKWLRGHSDGWGPIIFLSMPDGSHLQIDGNHRYYLAWEMGRPHILAALVPQSIWEKYLVDLPPTKLTGWSGL